MLLPSNLAELEGPVKQALQVHKKKKVKKVDEHGLIFATAGDKGVVRVWSTERNSATPLYSCQPLATPTSTPLSPDDTSQEEKERETSHVFTSLHHCLSLNSLCGVTHDHNLALYSLPELSPGKQVNSQVA